MSDIFDNEMLDSLRRTVVSRVLKVLLLLASVAIVAVIIQEWNSDSRLRILLVYIPVLIAIVLLNYLKSIPDIFSAIAVIVIFTMIAVSELLSFGLASLTYMFFLISVTLTGVIFSLRAGYIALIVSIIPIALTAFAYVGGYIPITNEQQHSSVFWGGWITSTLAYVVGAGTLMATVTLLVGDLHKYSTLLQKVLKRRNDEVTRAVEEVSRKGTLASMQMAFPKLFHKLNTPLGNALVAVSYLREKKDLDEETSNLLEIANSSLEDARSEIKKLRSLSLVLGDNRDTVSEDICEFLRENVELLTEGSSTKLEMSFNIESCLLSIDVLALVEVLKILIQNAEDHGGAAETGVKLTLSLDDKGELIIYISDNGPGIDSSDGEHVFEPFITKSGLHKMGLGLTIAKNITEERIGGTIELIDNDENGACFAIHIPNELSG